MKLGDLLNNQASKVGMQNDPALIAILSNSELANREIDDKFANALNQGLMSLDSAKNNYDLKNHFSATILNAVDAKLLENIDKFDIDEETLSKVRDDKNSYNKIQLLKDAINGNIEKLKADKPEDKSKRTELEKQITDLNNQLFNLRTQHDKEKVDWQTKYDGEIQNFLFTNYLASKNYANKDYSGDENSSFARMLIEKALKEAGAVISKDGDKLTLKQAGSPDLDYFDKDNKRISFPDFSDKVLASKKVLVVSDIREGKPSSNTLPPQINIPYMSGDKTATFNAAIQQSLGDIKPES